MPFNGEGNHYPILNWTHKNPAHRKVLSLVGKIPDVLSQLHTIIKFPVIRYIGIIAAFSGRSVEL
jgi:hypothetical protein